MSKGTLFDKVWDAHTVGTLPSGQTQLFIGLHLIHEVTSPQAFAMLRERGLQVMYPDRTVATVDHIVPTENQARPFVDPLAEEMMQELEKNCKDNGIRFYNIGSGSQGIVHVIAPEQGLTQPGMTIACGDSHTSTHGAFGAIAFGIGTSQVRDVLASQTLALSKLKVRKIEVNGTLPTGVYAKDVILHIIRKLGVTGGVGYAYEYAGTTFEQMNMEERMTVCNMSIEGGARCGYVNPDAVTFEYLKGRDFAPKGADWDKAVEWWTSLRSDANAEYDDVVVFDAAEIPPTVTWGITPGQGIAIDQPVPTPDELPEKERTIAQEAYQYMDLQPGQPIAGTKIDVCFIGSCTNGRMSDLREAAKIAKGRQVAEGVKAFVVPGSER
ncbi:3-isopropylmalate dehydratase large subunit, partial [filamentous cyanobacterium CCP2]